MGILKIAIVHKYVFPKFLYPSHLTESYAKAPCQSANLDLLALICRSLAPLSILNLTKPTGHF